MMRARFLWAVIVFGTFDPGIQGAAASATPTAKSGSAAAVQKSVANHQGRFNAQKVGSGQPRLPHGAPHLNVDQPSPAFSGHAAQRSTHPSLTGPNRVHFVPYSPKAGAMPGSHGNPVARHSLGAPLLGGPARYDAKKAAVVGGTTMEPRR